VVIEAGNTSRRKLVVVSGLSVSEALARLDVGSAAPGGGQP
jgi:hypothetical protein